MSDKKFWHDAHMACQRSLYYAVKEKNLALERLEQAEAVIRFYANEELYTYPGIPHDESTNIEDDKGSVARGYLEEWASNNAPQAPSHENPKP